MGAVILVAPGPGAPLQTAIDTARPGDTIRLQAGVFEEAIVVTKALRIIGAVGGPPRDLWAPNLSTIDGGCSAPYAVDVAADHVQLDRLEVRRGSEGGVRIEGRDRIQAWNVNPTARQGDASASCGTERYGINVVAGGKIQMTDGQVRGDTAATPTGLGFLDAGIRIADVVSTGRVDVRNYTSLGSFVGVLVEGSVGPGIKLKALDITAPDVGILLRDADAVKVQRSSVTAVNGLRAHIGLQVDADSTGNHLTGNTLLGSDLDLLDDAYGNCWRFTSFIRGTLPTYNCL